MSDSPVIQEVVDLRIQLDNLREEYSKYVDSMDNVRVKSELYDRICNILGIRSNILGYIEQFRGQIKYLVRTEQRIDELENKIRLSPSCPIDLNALSNMGISFIEKAVVYYAEAYEKNIRELQVLEATLAEYKALYSIQVRITDASNKASVEVQHKLETLKEDIWKLMKKSDR